MKFDFCMFAKHTPWFRLIVGLVLAAGTGFAADWTGAIDSSWSNAGNWQNGLVPSASDSVYIGESGHDPEISSGSYSCDDLYLSGAVSLTISGGELTCSKIAIGENGLLDIAGGQVTAMDKSIRMAVRLLMDKGRVAGYSGAGRVRFGSSGYYLILTAEQTDALASVPNPPDLSTDIAAGGSLPLSWTAGAGADTHCVYFSMDADEVIDGSSAAFQGAQTSIGFAAPVPEPGAVYYWRVDEVAGTVTNRGDVWSFRTEYSNRNRPLLGVIRWDMYSGMSSTPDQELGYLPGDYGFLAPEKWNWRAPFFCRYTNDVPWIDHEANGAVGPLWFNYPYEFSLTQEATDDEIAFAGTAGAGIDYWIFGTLPASAGRNGWGLYWNLDAFLESERKLEMNYALMYRLDSVDDWAEYDVAVEEMVWHAKQSNYQTVVNGRPLIYLIRYKDLSVTLGDPEDGSSVANLAAALQELRDSFAAAGLPDPYVVGSRVAANVYDDGNWIDGAGFNAGSDYRPAYGASAAGTTFSTLPDTLQPYWDLNGEQLSAALVPAIVCGADNRPRYESGYGLPAFYQEPEPGDLTKLLNRAMNYVVGHRDECEANTVLMYAWNENSEGGYLCPTIGESPDYIPVTWRLDEVATALNSFVSPPVPTNTTILVGVRADGLSFYYNPFNGEDGFVHNGPIVELDGRNAGDVISAVTYENTLYTFGRIDPAFIDYSTGQISAYAGEYRVNKWTADQINHTLCGNMDVSSDDFSRNILTNRTAAELVDFVYDGTDFWFMAKDGAVYQNSSVTPAFTFGGTISGNYFSLDVCGDGWVAGVTINALSRVVEYRDGIFSQLWAQGAGIVPGGVTHVASSADSDLVFVSRVDGLVYEVSGPQDYFGNNAQWGGTPVDAEFGPIDQVDSILRINSDGEIYCRDAEKVDAIRYLVDLGGSGYVDLAVLSVPVLYPGYGEWSIDAGLSGSAVGMDADADGDGVNNLLEYALGGDPANDDAAAILPRFGISRENGSSWAGFVHNEQVFGDRLTYRVLYSTNLVSGIWQTNQLEFAGESRVGNYYRSVTNRIETGPQGFIRLDVTYD